MLQRLTRNNTCVIIPNKEIIDNVLVNHSMYGETRVDIPVGIAYKEDIDAAREALLAGVAARPRAGGAEARGRRRMSAFPENPESLRGLTLNARSIQPQRRTSCSDGPSPSC